MNYYNDLLARLQKGETPDDIAAHLTEELNKANEDFQKSQITEKEKIAAADTLISHARAFFDNFFPEIAIPEDYKGTDLIRFLENSKAEFKVFSNDIKQLFDLLFKL